MRPALLHLDNALDPQINLARKVAARGGYSVDGRHLGPALRLWSRPKALEQLRTLIAEKLPPALGPLLTFSGSGDFHHITPLLLERALEAAGYPPVTVLHFDNHPDWVKFENGLHCGSWVGEATRIPRVVRVLTVGVCSDDIYPSKAKDGDLDLIRDRRLELYPYRAAMGRTSVTIADSEWPTIEAMGEGPFTDFLMTRIPTAAVYITIDKDVLSADEAATNWDQGLTSLSFLTAMLERIGARHQVIGADVVGDWSPGSYGGGLLPGLLKRGEALLDQSWARPHQQAVATGRGANLRLLDVFTRPAP